MTDDQYSYKHLHQARLEHERHEALLSFLHDRATQRAKMLNIRLNTYEEIEVPDSVLDVVHDPDAEKVLEFYHVAYDEYGRDDEGFVLGVIPVPISFLFSEEDEDDAAFWHREAREMGWEPTSNAKIGDLAQSITVSMSTSPGQSQQTTVESSKVKIVPNPVAPPFPQPVETVDEYVPVYELHPEDQAYADRARSDDQ